MRPSVVKEGEVVAVSTPIKPDEIVQRQVVTVVAEKGGAYSRQTATLIASVLGHLETCPLECMMDADLVELGCARADRGGPQI